MQLLVSVSSATEASAALAGGADVIDAKDPVAGPLGAVSLQVFQEICGTVRNTRPVSAALGDASDTVALERLAASFAAAGAAFLKVGFAGIHRPARVDDLLRSAIRGAGATGADRVQPWIVAVAYADADRAGILSPQAILDSALRTGARGVLLDTFDKSGPGLRQAMSDADLGEWIQAGRRRGLLVAIAGQLTATDMPQVRQLGADIVGVRGAACEGGRSGRVCEENVRRLADLADEPRGNAGAALTSDGRGRSASGVASNAAY
jgi:uncharacterized protein (UPF0264 family)